MSTSETKAPAGLSPEAQSFWKRITESWVLDDAGELLLLAALESWDRGNDARAILDRDGLVVEGRFGPKAHPMLAIERDAKAAMVRALAALHLDLPPDPKGK